jgi:hypothetical protein
LAPRCCTGVPACSQSGGPDRRNLCAALVAHRGMAFWRALGRRCTGEKESLARKRCFSGAGHLLPLQRLLDYPSRHDPPSRTTWSPPPVWSRRRGGPGGLVVAQRHGGCGGAHQMCRFRTSVTTLAHQYPHLGGMFPMSMSNQALQPAAVNDVRQGPGPLGGIPFILRMLAHPLRAQGRRPAAVCLLNRTFANASRWGGG